MKFVYQFSRVLAVVAALSLLTACGGGGGSSSSGGGDGLNINDLLVVPEDDGTVTVVLADGSTISIDEDLLPEDLIDGEGNIDLDKLPTGLVDADGAIDEDLLDELIGDVVVEEGNVSQEFVFVSTEEERITPKIGVNPEPVTGLLSLIALTAGGLAATRRTRKA